MPTAAQVLHELPEPIKFTTDFWQFAQKLYDHWHIEAVTARYANRLTDVAQYATVGELRRQVVAKSAGSREPVLHRWMCYSTDCRFKKANTTIMDQ
jgi:hypothetical protein